MTCIKCCIKVNYKTGSNVILFCTSFNIQRKSSPENKLFIMTRCLSLTLYCLNFFFRRFSGHGLRQVFFVYRLIVATLIGNILIIPFEIEIKILTERAIYGTQGSKRLTELVFITVLPGIPNEVIPTITELAGTGPCRLVDDTRQPLFKQFPSNLNTGIGTNSQPLRLFVYLLKHLILLQQCIQGVRTMN